MNYMIAFSPHLFRLIRAPRLTSYCSHDTVCIGIARLTLSNDPNDKDRVLFSKTILMESSTGYSECRRQLLVRPVNLNAYDSYPSSVNLRIRPSICNTLSRVLSNCIGRRHIDMIMYLIGDSAFSTPTMPLLVIFVGPSNTGKSKLVTLIGSLFGIHSVNVTGQSFVDMVNTGTLSKRMLHYSIMCVSELDLRSINRMSSLKFSINDEPQSLSEADGYSYTRYARVFASCNDLPRNAFLVGDNIGLPSISKRVLIIPMCEEQSGVDSRFSICDDPDEKQAFFNHCVAYSYRYRKNPPLSVDSIILGLAFGMMVNHEIGDKFRNVFCYTASLSNMLISPTMLSSYLGLTESYMFERLRRIPYIEIRLHGHNEIPYIYHFGYDPVAFMKFQSDYPKRFPEWRRRHAMLKDYISNLGAGDDSDVQEAYNYVSEENYYLGDF